MIGEHLHLVQEERFDVLEGTLRMRLNGDEMLHGRGETVVAPAGAPHSLGLEHQMYLAGPPIPLQRAAFRVLAGTGRLLGRG